MSGGPTNVNSKTTTEPPSYLQPLLQAAGGAALGSFTGQGTEIATGLGGIPQKKLGYFQKKFGDDLSGANPQQRARLQNKFGVGYQTIGAPGGPGDPGLIGQGQNLISDTLSGKFLSPDSNPYLEQTFNRGADLITNRLNTSFAGSGRNLEAGRPAAADDLGSFASQLFGNAYNFERGMQQNALSQGQAYDPINLLINRIAGIVPNAGGVTSSQQPVYRTGLF